MRDSADCFRLKLERITLANGLRIVLHPDDTLPLAALHVCYHVGSKDESPDLTGLAHLFEHLMFEGSAQHDDDYFRPLQEAGAAVNGSTGHDYTSYYEVVPSNFLERAIWLEADRMGQLLPALTVPKLENQRSVVKNERLQRIDNQPYGRVGEEIYSLLYDAKHPYHWPIIGWMDHLDIISFDDVCNFFRQYYTPSNAVVVLAGKYDRDEAIGWLEKYFGAIPAGPAVMAPAPRTPIIRGEYRRSLEEPVALGRIDLLWPTVPRFHPDEAALDLASLILGDGKDSRLRRRLERDDKLTHSIDAYHTTLKLSGHFGIWAYGLPESELTTIEKTINEVLKEFVEKPATEEELEQARRWFANRAYARVETVLGKAEMIQHYMFQLGHVDSDTLMQEIDKYAAVTAEDIERVVKQYITDRRVVVTVRPSESAEQKTLGKKTGATTTKHRAGANPDLIPIPGAVPSFTMPLPVRFNVGTLPVLVLPNKKLPRVTMQLLLDAGALWDTSDKLGVARLVSDCMDEGTTTRDALQIARQLELLGSTLGVSSGIESVGVSMRSLRSTLAETLDLMTDVLLQPAFHEADVLRERDRLKAELSHKLRQPRSLADDAIDANLFGAHHPYGRSTDGELDTLHLIGSEELHQFHQARYRPGQATLVVVGDVTPEEIEKLVADKFAAWLNLSPSSVGSGADSPQPINDPIHIIERPESTQSILRLGRLATKRDTPDYCALVLLNTILGGQFSSRLNQKLREEQGFTYGVNSSFVLRKASGSFLAGTDVDGRVTRDALRSMVEVILGPATDQPITAEELAFAKAYIIRRFPARFETQGSILGQIAHAVVYGLPDDYFVSYLDRLAAVTLDDIRRVAEKYLSRDGFKVVVVGRPEETSGLEEILPF